MKEKSQPPSTNPPLDTINGVKFTSREMDLLACIFGGRTPKKIAQLLSLSPRTVENYTYKIMLKIQCNSRECVIDFLERSDQATFLKNRYLTLSGKPQECAADIIPVQEKASSFFQKKFWQYAIIGFALIVCILGFASYTIPLVKDSIRSDLILPMDLVLLKRSELTTQIDHAFKKEGEGIQTVALVGIGGSGKTTLARLYAAQQNATLIWEINAETQSALNESFNNLAYALAKSDQDKATLRGFTEIKNSAEREKRLIEFVKEHLKEYSNWFLIFDNVEKFADVHKWFPLDPKTWGSGKIIVTTRDSNIQYSMHVNQTLVMGELNDTQKLDLFTKIRRQNEKAALTTTQLQEAEKFLKNIPPFPLDVSVSSYYLNATNVSYEEYMKEIENNSLELKDIQEKILKDSGNYSTTRYNIITLSLKNLLENNKDFEELFLFISLLDSQNIPKELLELYKNHNTADSFIHELKKHSLITTQLSPASGKLTIYIHRSTQSIILAYLKKVLDFENNNHDLIMKSFSMTLSKYAEDLLKKEDLYSARQLISHLETFLAHKNLLSRSVEALIESELGYIYASLSLFQTASHLLENATLKLREEIPQQYDKIAKNLLIQGNALNISGDYKPAESKLEESIHIYEKYLPDNYAQRALSLIFLGNVYRWSGKYEKALPLFQQGLDLHQKYSPQTYATQVMGLVFQGEVERSLGYYTKALESLQRSLEICEKHLPKENVHRARAVGIIGMVQYDLGDYKKAIDFIREAIRVYVKNFSKDSIYVHGSTIYLAKAYNALGNYKLALEHAVSHTSHPILNVSSNAFTGNAYKGMEKYEKAKIYLEKALNYYMNDFGENHVETAQILKDLGDVYFLEGNLEAAESLFTRALTIFQEKNHPSAYKCLESFSDMAAKKYQETKEKNVEEAQYFKTKAVDELSKALEIVKAALPPDAPHIMRIEAKLKKLERS